MFSSWMLNLKIKNNIQHILNEKGGTYIGNS